MGTFLIRRLVQIVPLLFGITILVFLLVNAVPGSPVSDLQFNPDVTPEDIAQAKHALGLDQPLYTRYFVWLGNVAHGDLGQNLITHRPVSRDIAEKLPNTLKLTVAAFLLAIGLAIPLGVYSALRRNTWFDNVATFAATAGVAIPRFWFGLILILVFAVNRRWFPTGGTVTLGAAGGGLGDQLRHLVLPAITLAIAELSGWTRYIRGQMLEVIRQDYIRTAHAKGLHERTIIFRHALRNAFLPLVTLLGLALPEFFGGALIVETIFSWPGIGRLTYDAAVQRNYTVIMGTVLLSSVLVILGNLFADIGYGLLDPRIKQR